MLKKRQHAASADDPFAADILKGLRASPRTIASKWLYDSRGSEIFEEITEVEDYYLTRTEAAIFESVFPALEEKFPAGSAVAEFGSGASVKTRDLLTALRPATYVPIDIADDFLQDAAETLHQLFPALEIIPLVADLTASYVLPQSFCDNDFRLGFFPGSTIGNFTEPTAIAFLRHAREAMGAGAHLLISADLVKEATILERAYDDSEGVTARFTLNLLTRMNEELNANFDPGSFRHVAEYNKEKDRIEICFESLADQEVTVAGEKFQFATGDRVRTEYSHKYTPESFAGLLQAAGWQVEEFWTDERGWFGVFLAGC